MPQAPAIDSLTAYSLRASRLLAQCRREGGQLALLWVEVAVLAPPGRTVAEDEQEGLIHTASQRLRNRVRSSDEVQRVGERAFAVMLLNAGVDEAALVERRLVQALRGTYGMEGQLTQLALRIGTAVFPEDGRQAGELAEVAQRSMRV